MLLLGLLPSFGILICHETRVSTHQKYPLLVVAFVRPVPPSYTLKVMPEKEKALALVCLAPGGIGLAAMEHFAGWKGDGILIMIFSMSFTRYFPKQFIFVALAWGGPVALLRLLTHQP